MEWHGKGVRSSAHMTFRIYSQS